jgi:divalent metal cation (Fe/Co/Zn/Cd) transporter
MLTSRLPREDRVDRIIAALRDARTAVLTTAGFTCGTAAVWTEWGVSAGLGGAAVSLLLLEALTDRKART